MKKKYIHLLYVLCAFVTGFLIHAGYCILHRSSDVAIAHSNQAADLRYLSGTVRLLAPEEAKKVNTLDLEACRENKIYLYSKNGLRRWL